MIESLVKQYDKIYEKTGDIPRMGYSHANIGMVLRIDEDGNLINVEYLPEHIKHIAPKYLKKRSADVLPYFLWDKSKYVLGVDDKNKKSLKFHTAFKDLVDKVCEECHSIGAHAIKKFLDSWDPDNIEELEHYEDLLKSTTFIAFKLVDEDRFIFEDPALEDFWAEQYRKNELSVGNCVLTGEKCEVIKKHGKLLITKGGTANLISSDKCNFVSNNIPKEDASALRADIAHKYIAAINYMTSNTGNCVRNMYGTDVLFWDDLDDLEAAVMKGVIDPEKPDDSESMLSAVLEFKKGKYKESNIQNNIYILGLYAPNSGRAAIDYWYTYDMYKFMESIKLHMLDSFKPEGPQYSIKSLIQGLGINSKNDAVRKLLAKRLFHSILTQTQYPLQLFTTALERVIHDKSERFNSHITNKRIAILRGYMNRCTGGLLRMGLNKDIDNVAYLLGRYFAVVECATEIAFRNEGRSRAEVVSNNIFNIAVSHPILAMPQIEKAFIIAAKKLDSPIYFRKQIDEILNKIQDIPKRFCNKDRAMFILGRSAQRDYLYTKNKDDKEEN